ncbi:EAL domain-containing response regulator [Marinobacter fonticola]|uniref:EAL domain-containing response regulator n=1 Tax=Marinobacter fonticola TaxID=2603215 RepID=UPI0011E839BB|nr:EAL domain-containing protein [Marinobacter fonticola]
METEQRANILVVDDNAAKRQALSAVLEELGQNVVLADSGHDALRSLLARDYAVILMDVQMPGMDGFEAASLIRSRGRSALTPIIFVTSYSDAETDMLGGYSLGAVDFIFAPVIPEILRAKVSVFVELFHTTQQLKRHEDHLESLVRQRTSALTAEIAERERAELIIRKLSSAVEKVADSIFITDTEGVIEYVNPAFEATTGYGDAEAIGKTPQLIRSGEHEPAFYANIWETLGRGEIYREVVINRKKDGQLYHEAVTITPLADDKGRCTHYIFSGKDMTERMQTQERLHHLAHHDILTDLPNRMLFVDHLKQALSRAKWRDRSVAVIFVDLDRFKIVNDTLGHEAGDQLLQAISERMQSCMREGDIAARFGGDEFAVFLNDIASQDDVAPLAQNLLEAMSPPFMIAGQELFITCSLGISLYPDDGHDTQALMQNADTAMYWSKQQGGNSYHFYQVAMNAHAMERLQLETDLRHALEREEFALDYQPQYDLESGALVGVEALLRWHRPGFGIVSPENFIPLLEENGLIVPVGEWVLQTACAQHQKWTAEGLPPVALAINVSGRQVDTKVILETVSRVLESTGMTPELLELELTESVLMENIESIGDVFRTLKSMGLKFAIDDFGTGFSSLSYLKNFPVDALKIDKDFVQDITTDADSAAIVIAIISLAHALGMRSVAEGVETQEQVEFLWAQGCNVAQGRYFSAPYSAEEFESQVARQGSFGFSESPLLVRS